MMLDVRDLQKILRIGRDKSYALMHADAFPSIKIGGRYYVSQDALERWLLKYEYKEFVI